MWQEEDPKIGSHSCFKIIILSRLQTITAKYRLINGSKDQNVAVSSVSPKSGLLSHLPVHGKLKRSRASEETIRQIQKMERLASSFQQPKSRREKSEGDVLDN